MSKKNSDINKKEMKVKLDDLQNELASLQQEMDKVGLPVIILFEGLSASGKGVMISKTIAELDPRYYKVYSTTVEIDAEKRRPLMWGFWDKIPAYGKMCILDRSWYNRTVQRISTQGYSDNLVNSINTFESQLASDGYLILKFFLNISKKEQKNRLMKLSSDPFTSWRVTERDLIINKNFDYHAKMQSDIREKTNTDFAPWNIIESEDEKSAATKILEIINAKISEAIAQGVPLPQNDNDANTNILPVQKLSVIPLNLSVEDKEYKKTLKEEKEKLQRLHSLLYREKIPVILCFEGWDAAGKGGAIRRLTSGLDPRGFEVIPIAAPSGEAKVRHYLWRFWEKIPKDGHIAIFDRTWYGRVMVERIENFTAEKRWMQAYKEMNDFEQELHEWGAVIIKFWIQIDKDEQLNRFNARQTTPEKMYKITDEDWRNRDKWDLYEQAVNDMIEKTSTSYAPWVIVEGNDKKYARLKIMRTVREALEKKLELEGEDY